MAESMATNKPALDQYDRVRANTAPEINEQLDNESAERVRYLAQQPNDVIAARLEALEGEWDVERVLETNASSLLLIGTVFSALFSRKWLLLPFVVAAFLLQHAIQGWCPPIEVFRRIGVRTRREIEAEKTALRLVRGDYASVAGNTPAERVEESLRLAGLK